MTLAEPTGALQSSYGAAVATLLRGDPLADAIVVADAQRDSRLSGIASDLATAGVRALLVVPLRFRDEPMGALALASPEPGRFADDTPALLRRQARRSRSPSAARCWRPPRRAARTSWRRRWARSAARGPSSPRRRPWRAWRPRAGRGSGPWPRRRGLRWSCWTWTHLPAGPRRQRWARRRGLRRRRAVAARADPPRPGPRRHPGAGRARERPRRGRSLHLPDDAPQDAAALLGPLLGPGSTRMPGAARDPRRAVAALVAVSLDPERPVDAARLERAERFAPALALAVAGARRGASRRARARRSRRSSPVRERSGRRGVSRA